MWWPRHQGGKAKEKARAKAKGKGKGKGGQKKGHCMRWQFNGSCEYKDPKDGGYKCEYRHEEEQKGIFDRKGKDGKKTCVHFAKLGSCWNSGCPLAHEDIPEAHPTKWCEGLGHGKGNNNNIPYINPKFDTKYDMGHVNMAFAFDSVCDPDTCSQAKMGGKYCDLRAGEGLGQN